MVRVSRGAGEPSGFLVVVADSGESIEKSSEAAGRCRAFVITVHQRGRRRKLAEGAVQMHKSKGLVGGHRRREAGARRKANIPIDNCRYNEYYGFPRPRRWAMMDIRK